MLVVVVVVVTLGGIGGRMESEVKRRLRDPVVPIGTEAAAVAFLLGFFQFAELQGLASRSCSWQMLAGDYGGKGIPRSGSPCTGCTGSLAGLRSHGVMSITWGILACTVEGLRLAKLSGARLAAVVAKIGPQRYRSIRGRSIGERRSTAYRATEYICLDIPYMNRHEHNTRNDYCHVPILHVFREV